MIQKDTLEKLYITDRKSMMEISKELGFSHHKVVYWMDKHAITRRTISEAVYQKINPKGDPFSIKEIQTLDEAELFGLGIGLYWGEGTKANKYSLRLGNSDPSLLDTWIQFLTKLYGVSKADLRFGLQIFTDIAPNDAINYWIKELNIEETQFYKVHITPSGSLGTYRKKSKYGVLTVYFHNKKLRDIIVGLLPR